MRKWLIAAALALTALLPTQSKAVCTPGGAPLNLEIPNINGDRGDIWGPCITRDLAKLSTSAVVSSSFSLLSKFGQIAVSTITGNANGEIYVTSGAYFTKSGPTSYSVTMSSGGRMLAGGWKMPDNTVFFSTSQFGAGTGGHRISTGTLGVGATAFATQPGLKFDGAVFSGANDSATGETFMTLNVGSSSLNRTVQRFTSGSGTYTPSSGASQIIVHVTGGGCGGGGANNVGNAAGGGGGAGSYQSWLVTNPTTYSYSVSTGANGGGVGVQGSSATPTTFGSLTSGSCGMGQGAPSGNTNGRPGAGGVPAGTITGGSVIFLSTGGVGYAGSINGSDADAVGGEGGTSFHGGGGSGGGAPSSDFTRICSSGTAPGSGGGGGAGGAANSGCAGARGEIVVEEFFPAIGPAGATGATGPAGFSPITCYSSTTAPATTVINSGTPVYIEGSSCTLKNVTNGSYAIFHINLPVLTSGAVTPNLSAVFDGTSAVLASLTIPSAAYALFSGPALWFGPLSAGDHTLFFKSDCASVNCSFPPTANFLKVTGITAPAP